MRRKQKLLRNALVLLVGVAVYLLRDRLPELEEAGLRPPGQTNPAASSKPASAASGAPPSAKGPFSGYESFPDARYVEHRGNDGDSFHVRAGGHEFELRLYFVDAPETYVSDRFPGQRRRVEEQARALGGLSVEQTLEVGKQATEFVRELVANRPFTVHTYWEPVFDSDRRYVFVELSDGSDLAEQLVAAGLARIHTKGPGSRENPVPTPRGESFSQARRKLGILEREARTAKRGAWGY